jgi:hypothetical protein
MAPVARSFDEVDRFAAEVRADDAVRSRARRTRLAQQAAEEATFRGVLIDLGERGSTVVVHLAVGRPVVGRVRQVGTDFVDLLADDGREVLVALRGVGHVRTAPGAPPTTGSRDVAGDLTLVEALVWRAGDRPRVQVRAGGAEPVAGELREVGADVATVLLEGSPGGWAYINVSEVTEVRLG